MMAELEYPEGSMVWGDSEVQLQETTGALFAFFSFLLWNST